ncbi:MAG: hypothetical protein Q4F95_07355 [Oscillospiraceae bacterium]|nr:hypothetical protein [Oscillospiraceae bacterium]
MRPIDADELLDRFHYSEHDTEDEKIMVMTVRRMVKEQPTLQLSEVANAKSNSNCVEVKHGEWIKTSQTMFPEQSKHYCSECENFANTHLVFHMKTNSYSLEEYLDNYCPHCGAKMDGGQTDETK